MDRRRFIRNSLLGLGSLTLGCDKLEDIYYLFPGVLYVGTNGNGLYISEDGGNTYTQRTTADGLGGNSIIGIFVTDSKIYCGTVGGVSISTDGGKTFTNYTNGLASTNLTRLFVYKSIIYAGTSAGLAISRDGGASFTNYNAADNLDVQIWDVFVTDSAIYVACENNYIGYSTDGGYTYSTLSNGMASNEIYTVFEHSGVIYAGTLAAGMSVSYDGGQSFYNYNQANNNLGNDAVPRIFYTNNTLYAATNGGGLSISYNKGQSFVNRTTAHGLGSLNLNSINVFGDKVFAATLNGLSISNDGGQTFTNYLPGNNIQSVFVY